jgi:putative oxidoreductase
MREQPTKVGRIPATSVVSIRADLWLLVARTCLSAVFLFSGFSKLFDTTSSLAEMQAFGLPPQLALVGTVTVQILAGLAVLLGSASRLGALILAAFTAAATLVGHQFWVAPPAAFTRELTIALEHLAIIGGFLLLTVTGPGRLRIATPLDRLDRFWRAPVA